MTDEEFHDRLSTYSQKTNINATQIALLEQRLTVAEKRLEEYHLRTHKAEDELLVIKTVQAIHDTQIMTMRKLFFGNGERETIPMDIERLERSINDILSINPREVSARLKVLEERYSQTTRLRDRIVDTALTVLTSAFVTWMLTQLFR